MSASGIKVFVGNLPENCSKEALQDLFAPYGNVVDLIMVKTYAFLTFDSDDDAKKAVDDLHKTKMLGRELTVQISTSKQSRGITSGRGGGGGRSNDRNDRRARDDQRRKSSGLALPDGVAPPLNAGGILGAGPNPLFNAVQAVSNVVAVASGRPSSEYGNDRQQYSDSRDPPAPVPRDPPRQSLNDGYVIYERYYVDPKHPLLKGLPLPELPRVTDSYASQDSYADQDRYVRKQDDYAVSDYRERSPIQSRRELNDYDRERNRYNDNYFDRR